MKKLTLCLALAMIGGIVMLLSAFSSGHLYAGNPRTGPTRQMRALVVGIGDYPESSGWNRINGDRDVDLAVRMLMRNGFAREDISVLVNGQATKSAIRDAFSRLIAESGSGDVIYIHFSGHGQQVRDINGDEEDGLDEAFVPFDARRKYSKGVYEGGNHIVDDELNVWLESLKDAVGKNGNILFVMDACHSGGSTRGEEDECTWPMRGTSDVFEMVHESSLSPSVTSDIGVSDINWLFLAACKSYQNNYEYKTEDGYYGRLTWALYKCLDSGMNFYELIQKLEESYEGMPHPPVPQNLDAFSPSGMEVKLF